MSANTSPDLGIVGDTNASNNGSPFPGLQQVISCSTASRGNCFSQFTSLSSGSSSFSPTTPSAMSAAAAAAFLLRTAANGSMNGDGSSNSSLPARRCSTTSLFESPQASPSFPSSVISAAAQQAALAAAQAISTNSSPNSKASSDLQAAVLSLALAANPNNSLQSDSNKYTQSDRPGRPSQAVTDLLFLSERHPEILTSHPTLASVFRRRSSTVLPTYLSDLTGGDFGLQSGDRLPASSVGMSLSSSLASALEAMNPQRPATSDLSGSMLPDQSIVTAGSSNTVLSSSFHTERSRKESETDVDPYRFTSSSAANIASASDLYGPKHSRHFSPTFDPTLTSVGNPVQTTVGLPLGQDTRSFSRSSAAVSSNYRGSPRSDSTNPAHYSSYPSNTCGRTSGPLPQPCHSPVPAISHVTDATPTPGMCQSSSPLSCSSLSNTGTSAVNISPVLLSDGSRMRNQMGTDGLSGSDGKPGLHYGSHLRSDRLREQDIKSEYGSSMGQYQDEPSRKREQRLIKNREAARECRRKKKEYVKCLEARVSLLESQNQELIEELQKVKALCFNELCGLGLNSSTAACAAAVLAAVTSGPGTYSAGAPTISNMKTSDRVSDVSGHLSDQVSPSHSALSLDNPQGSSTHLDTTMRPHRARRQSILTDTKLHSVAGGGSNSGVLSRSAVYQPVCDSTQSGRSYVHDETELKTNNRDPSLNSHPPYVNDMPTECTSSPNGGTIYDAGATDTNDLYRTRNHLSLNQSSHLGGSTTRRMDPSSYRQQQHSPQKTGALMSSYTTCSSTQSASTTATTSTGGNYYHHPHYAAKRAYRAMATTNPDVKPEFAAPQQQQTKEDGNNDSAECRPKSTRHSNSVAGAAVILAAAAAAMANESESSDPRISV